MSRSLARARLHNALDALLLAQSNVDEALREFSFERDQELAQDMLNLTSRAIGEVRQAVREAMQLTQHGLLLPS